MYYNGQSCVLEFRNVKFTPVTLQRLTKWLKDYQHIRTPHYNTAKSTGMLIVELDLQVKTGYHFRLRKVQLEKEIATFLLEDNDDDIIAELDQ